MSGHTCAMPVDGEEVAYDIECDACVALLISLVGSKIPVSSIGVKPDWTTCEACGLEYMGAHRCRAREGADPVAVLNEKLWIDAYVTTKSEAGGRGRTYLSADECAELSAAFGAIARRLRKKEDGR